jgi:hypothetical protein
MNVFTINNTSSPNSSGNLINGREAPIFFLSLTPNPKLNFLQRITLSIAFFWRWKKACVLQVLDVRELA